VKGAGNNRAVSRTHAPVPADSPQQPRAARPPTGNLRLLRASPGRGAGRRDRRSPDAVEPFITAAGLVSVFRVNLEDRDSDKEPPGECAERALDLLEHSLGEYAVSPTTCPAEQKCRICAHHGRTVTRQSATPNGGYARAGSASDAS
jgi:hypothetical protein